MDQISPSAPGSAVPEWLTEILPPWFKERPAFSEAAYAFFVSMLHSTGVIATVMYSAASADGATTLPAFVGWLPSHWFAAVAGFVVGGGFASSRAVTAHAKANAAITR